MVLCVSEVMKSVMKSPHPLLQMSVLELEKKIRDKNINSQLRIWSEIWYIATKSTDRGEKSFR